MGDTNIDALFHLPPRELKALTFSRADKASIEEWTQNLPKADMGKSTRMLYLAIKEVCELQTTPANRMVLIEALRPSIHLACKGLKKNYMNQPVILPEQPRKIANLSHALQSHLAIAYVITACQCSEKMGKLLKKPTILLSQAIYHAMLEYTSILIRNYLLYRPDAPNFWKHIHRLYQLAHKYKLHPLPQIDDEHENGTISIDQSYMQLLLWGCIKANQLRQDDINRLKQNMREWSGQVKLAALDKTQDSAFVIDPKMDTPPVYQKFYQGRYNTNCTSLDTGELIRTLEQLSAPLLQKKSGLSTNLINHLILAWGVFTGRTFMRLEANSQLALCIGLSTTHYYLGDEKPFGEFVYGGKPPKKAGASTAKFKEGTRTADKLDVWDESVYGTTKKSEAQVTMESIDYHIRSGGQSMMTFTGSDKEKYQDYKVAVVNMSPGGYCLEWDKNIPHTIKAGEIIGVMEDHHNTWNIGAIRWVRQSKEKSLQIGVELLSPNAIPYGARISDSEGNPQSDFMRVLALPEIKTAGQPCSILTPAVSFKPGQTVLLASNGKEQTVELKKLIGSSGSYLQFTYKGVKTLAQPPSSGNIDGSIGDGEDSDLDSVWELL